MTIGWWVFTGLILIGGIVLGVAGLVEDEKSVAIGGFIGGIVLAILLCLIGHWFCNNTQTGIRAMKDQQSNYNGGLLREVVITAEDGREIYYYKGSIDIETNPENKYILFETEEGLRQMIYYGITDTVLILEVEH